MIPFLDVGYDYKVAFNEVLVMIPLGPKSTIELRKSYKKSGDLFDATKGRTGKTLIILKNGQAIVSALTSTTLVDNCRELKTIERNGVYID